MISSSTPASAPAARTARACRSGSGSRRYAWTASRSAEPAEGPGAFVPGLIFRIFLRWPCALEMRRGFMGLTMLSNRINKKRAVNLFVDVELLDEARRMRINISETLESRLRTIVRAEQERRWLDANKVAIAAYNLRVARDGLLADEAGLL